MDAHIKRVYVPMTEACFYILLCLQRPAHGYGIVQQVRRLTGGELTLAPGTLYGVLTKAEADGLIRFVRLEETRKLYQLTPLGQELLALEKRRIQRLYQSLQQAQGPLEDVPGG